MNATHSTLCCLLLVLMLHADHASAAGMCFHSEPWVPFCNKWLCKSECKMEAKLLFTSATVKEHWCIKGGFKGKCHCLICNNK
ncbi:hypothetical protein EJB05_14302 [Eragrostis curvula]|uniref:Knottin scorpion toxin-like domain-containing protein n=1 Tax=Eragrostis curvula TaxID=38414 RepID=A0A5J9SHW9_9POAL|nr:hypothetical protein EJB05_55816 [Eragrostis curvula]TVU40823.1 hypothetical protein EJB05_14302 [Eragrostis curvula]